MKGHGAKFGRRKEEAIVALLTRRNVEEAAKAIGIAPATLLRWQQIPEFDAAYRKARRDAFGQSIARLQQAASAAVNALLKLAVEPTAPAAVKVRAAYYILTLGMKSMESEDFDRRIADLERVTELQKRDSADSSRPIREQAQTTEA